MRAISARVKMPSVPTATMTPEKRQHGEAAQCEDAFIGVRCMTSRCVGSTPRGMKGSGNARSGAARMVKSAPKFVESWNRKKRTMLS